MAVRIAPSILAADFARLADEIARVKEAGADLIHIDVMDGHFVPNLSIGPPLIAALKAVTHVPLDVHVMVQDPDALLPALLDACSNRISVHLFIDIASDIAFLAVDLERLGASTLAHHFVRSYVGYSGDLTLYRLLDFYRCYRAYVRGKVTSIRLRDMSASDQRSQLKQCAELYFALAETYARCFSRPLIVYTTGLIASGKSTVAEGVATALDLQWIRSDQVRKELAGITPQTSQHAAYRAGIYTPEATQRTYAALAERTRQAIARGDFVVLNASFSKRAQRQRIADLAHELGADCCASECTAPETVIRQRLRQRADATDSMSDARADILASFQRDYEPIQSNESTCHVRVDTAQPIAVCVSQALADIQQQRLRGG